MLISRVDQPPHSSGPGRLRWRQRKATDRESWTQTRKGSADWLAHIRARSMYRQGDEKYRKRGARESRAEREDGLRAGDDARELGDNEAIAVDGPGFACQR
jgi:hypothetical protein